MDIAHGYRNFQDLSPSSGDVQNLEKTEATGRVTVPVKGRVAVPATRRVTVSATGRVAVPTTMVSAGCGIRGRGVYGVMVPVGCGIRRSKDLLIMNPDDKQIDVQSQRMIKLNGRVIE